MIQRPGSVKTRAFWSNRINTPLDMGGNLSVSLEASYRSRVYYREFGQKGDSTDPYTIVNLNVNWHSDNGLQAARLFARNATNEAYVTNIQGSNTTYGRQGTWNMPRQIGVEVTRFFVAQAITVALPLNC